jgi:GAF domain-containing protein
MMRAAGLLDQFAGLIAGDDEPRRVGERTLEVLMALVNGRSAGVFAVGKDRLTLFASRGIDQYVLDAVETLWKRGKERLRRGEPVYVPDTSADVELAGRPAGPASLAVLPVHGGDELVALLYLDSAETHFCPPADVERLRRFSGMLARAVRPETETGPRESAAGWEAYLERTPVQDIERQKLLLLLNRNEWNIARVARLMGVTRRTIYLRLQRYKIPRERVYKTRLRSAS